MFWHHVSVLVFLAFHSSAYGSGHARAQNKEPDGDALASFQAKVLLDDPSLWDLCIQLPEILLDAGKKIPNSEVTHLCD